MGQRERHTVAAALGGPFFTPCAQKGSPHIVGTSEWVWLGSGICTEVLLQGRRNKGVLSPPPPPSPLHNYWGGGSASPPSLYSYGTRISTGTHYFMCDILIVFS